MSSHKGCAATATTGADVRSACGGWQLRQGRSAAHPAAHTRTPTWHPALGVAAKSSTRNTSAVCVPAQQLPSQHARTTGAHAWLAPVRYAAAFHDHAGRCLMAHCAALCGCKHTSVSGDACTAC